jgi:hypothetical protein
MIKLACRLSQVTWVCVGTKRGYLTTQHHYSCLENDAQNAPDCTDFNLSFKFFWGAACPRTPLAHLLCRLTFVALPLPITFREKHILPVAYLIVYVFMKQININTVVHCCVVYFNSIYISICIYSAMAVDSQISLFLF